MTARGGHSYGVVKFDDPERERERLAADLYQVVAALQVLRTYRWSLRKAIRAAARGKLNKAIEIMSHALAVVDGSANCGGLRIADSADRRAAHEGRP